MTDPSVAEPIESLEELHELESDGLVEIAPVPDSGFLCPILLN